jgi:ribosome biogenesis protein BMS1
MSSEQQSHKPHRSKGKPEAKQGKHDKGRNPKAFTSQSGAKASRLARQKVEKDQKRLHVPAIDRTFGGYGAGPSNSKSSVLGNANLVGKDEGPPPVIVAVVGPPGVR